MKLLSLFLVSMLLFGKVQAQNPTVNLTVVVNDLRNNNGLLKFVLYNKDGTIPDETYKKYYKIKTSAIKNNSSTAVFINLPKGTYAVNILHDENKDGKIDKGFIFPVEGIGFSNLTKIGLGNRPSFKKASFELNADKKINIKIIYF